MKPVKALFKTIGGLFGGGSSPAPAPAQMAMPEPPAPPPPPPPVAAPAMAPTPVAAPPPPTPTAPATAAAQQKAADSERTPQGRRRTLLAGGYLGTEGSKELSGEAKKKRPRTLMSE